MEVLDMTKVPEVTTAWVIASMSALAHESRLATYRLLVQAGPGGLSAGEIAERLNLVSSSLTFHVQALSRAGLVTQRRVSRSIFYAADYSAMNNLVGYLMQNCCDQGAAVCFPACDPGKPSSRQQELQTGTKRA
jgi:DNA-binding transcriptional ArsR family regulator